MTTTTDPAPLGFPEASEKGLKGGALGLLSSVVVGMASTAPAYSLAASLGLVVATAGSLGMKAPAIMVLAFIPMYFIAIAYQELNKAEPDCGTTFTWATRAFGPVTGWMGGWGIIAADVIVMANLAQVAGTYSYYMVGEIGSLLGQDWSAISDLGDSYTWSTLAGVLWIVIMTYICYRGIEVSARLQYALLGIELVVLVVFAVVALVKVYGGTAESYSLTPSLSWLWPGGLSFSEVLAPALLTAFFIYWGWDTAVACNEESDDPGTTPGRAAVISTVLLLATYAVVSIAAVAFAGVGTEGIGLGNPDNSADVFKAIGPDLFGDSPLGIAMLILLIASVLTSAAASTQTTILPTARTALSMGVFRALPSSFKNVHAKYLTPTAAAGRAVATLVVEAPHRPDRHRHRGDGRGVDRVLRDLHDHLDQPALCPDRLGRFDDRVLLRPHRICLRLVLSPHAGFQRSRSLDAGHHPAGWCADHDGNLRLRAQELP